MTLPTHILIAAIQPRKISILIQNLALICCKVFVYLLWVADYALLVGVLGEVLQILLLLLRNDVCHGVARVAFALIRQLRRPTIIGPMPRQALLTIIRIMRFRRPHVHEAGVAGAVHFELHAVLGEMTL